METVTVDGAQVAVKEVSRPRDWDCRLLETVECGEYILGYLVSAGPYKIDVERFHRLTGKQTELYKAGHLQLSSLARDLAGE